MGSVRTRSDCTSVFWTSTSASLSGRGTEIGHGACDGTAPMDPCSQGFTWCRRVAIGGWLDGGAVPPARKARTSNRIASPTRTTPAISMPTASGPIQVTVAMTEMSAATPCWHPGSSPRGSCRSSTPARPPTLGARSADRSKWFRHRDPAGPGRQGSWSNPWSPTNCRFRSPIHTARPASTAANRACRRPHEQGLLAGDLEPQIEPGFIHGQSRRTADLEIVTTTARTASPLTCPIGMSASPSVPNRLSRTPPHPADLGR